MKTKLLRVAACLLILGSVVDGQRKQSKSPCAAAKTQGQLEDCFCDRVKRADHTLNSLYQQLLTKNASNTEFIEKLQAAQRAWLSFREAQLLSIYPEQDNPRASYGSVYTMCNCMAQEELILARTKQLKRMLWSKEGDVCGWTNH